MPAHARPQIEPDRYWYLSAYGRALKRIVAAVVLTFACFRYSEGAAYVWYSVTGHHPFHQPLYTDQPVDQTLNGILPFRVLEPVYVQFGDYVGSVAQSPVTVVLVLAGLFTLVFHIWISLRRRRR